MYSYQKIVRHFLEDTLDDDTKSIVEKYSVFYINKDYDKITQYLKTKADKIKYDFFYFLLINNFHFYVFKACNDELSSRNFMNREISLDEIMEIIKNKIKIESNYCPIISSFIISLYYDPPSEFPTPVETLFFESQICISNLLKELNLTYEEEDKYLTYLSKNLKKVNSEILKFYEEYKNNFMKYIKLI